MKLVIAAFVLVAVLCEFSTGQSTTMDHQTTTYYGTRKPVTVTNEELTITSYFSPDTSISVETWLIGNATTSIDIANPSFDSWSNCSGFTKEASTVGCSVSFVRNSEQFPIFHALLNAVHNGLTVRIITNWDSSVVTSPGLITPLDFLSVAGAQVRYYTSTDFMHAKYIAVDGEQASISSINFSYTSFMENREAGVIISGPGSAPLLSFLNDTFTYDFTNGGVWPTNTYTAAQRAIIDNPALDPIVIPPPRYISGAYVSTAQTVTAVMDEVTVFTAPDYAWSTFTGDINATSSSFELYIYQVTTPGSSDTGFCKIINSIATSVSTFKMLVSLDIVSNTDYYNAKDCYKYLTGNGVTVQEGAYGMFKFSHQKVCLPLFF
eukprot:TRINITY_DN5335_c0_g1_i2.p1 TRINITY_DN5335_c0_g1~~TRINITY_DN5335_c0_g1_i2.p1  ORF type:complete len:394 (+),score=48.57 TRINITY_DN5335_c0_g1_i2:49-1182(+)